MGALAAIRTGVLEEVATYRVTRTVYETGQFNDDECFLAWAKATDGVEVLSSHFETGGKRRFHVWKQTKQVPVPTACELTLVTSNGRSGWATEDEAEAVADSALAKASGIDTMVQKANDAALNPLNWGSNDSPDKPSEWGWVKWVLGGAVVVGGIYSVAKLVRG